MPSPKSIPIMLISVETQGGARHRTSAIDSTASLDSCWVPWNGWQSHDSFANRYADGDFRAPITTGWTDCRAYLLAWCPPWPHRRALRTHHDQLNLGLPW